MPIENPEKHDSPPPLQSIKKPASGILALLLPLAEKIQHILKKIPQKITHTPFLRRMMARFFAIYLKIMRSTSGLTIHNSGHIQSYWKKNQPVIVVFWHNRMALAPFAWHTHHPFFMMISEHPDGKIISEIVQHFGIQTLSVSSDPNKRGQSLKQALRCLRQGQSIGITPDGPKGPCYQAKKGVFLSALASGCDVLALTYATSNHRRFGSWDRFFFPLPFGTGHLIWSTPLPAPKHKDEEQDFLKTLTHHLNQITTRAHEQCGIAPDNLTEISQLDLNP